MNKTESVVWIVFWVIIAIIIVGIYIWLFITVPVRAQEKGFNVYLWIVLVSIFGLLSYWLINNLRYNHCEDKDEKKYLVRIEKKDIGKN